MRQRSEEGLEADRNETGKHLKKGNYMIYLDLAYYLKDFIETRKPLSLNEGDDINELFTRRAFIRADQFLQINKPEKKTFYKYTSDDMTKFEPAGEIIYSKVFLQRQERTPDGGYTCEMYLTAKSYNILIDAIFKGELQVLK